MVTVLIWLIVGLIQAQEELQALKSLKVLKFELTEARKEAQVLQNQVEESEVKLIQAKNESKSLAELETKLKQAGDETEVLKNVIENMKNDLTEAQNESKRLESQVETLKHGLEKSQENSALLAGKDFLIQLKHFMIHTKQIIDTRFT